ncbi:MAG: CDGSH iron-sulfur domain-containing protein [Gemmatimonadetes bacterium]|nr:CDGSH iron-sulfur domain-containing protein [Gemmatimonadota bacterium]
MSEKPTIVPSENGPYLVTNCRALKGMMDGKEYPTDGTVALCRCGGSKNKPFCDGTHKRNGFSSDKDPGRVPDKRDEYVGAGITVHDNRGICAHSARCTDSLSAVFRLKEEPFVAPDGDRAEQVAATIQGCPSGALSYSIDGVEHRDRESDPMILIVPNGPYVIRGGADLQGVEWGDGASHEHFTLCRCGQSQNKPFCSGAHWHHHFDEHAPPR